MESPLDLYYLHVPKQPRPVPQPVEFLAVQQFLDDEDACRRLWDLVTSNFHTRSKFLSLWSQVRWVAAHKRAGKLGGFLLVSTPINWQIDYVTVAEELRGQQVAESLVNETLNQALRRKVPYVMLTSRESLRGFYEGRCGFTVVAKSGG